MRASDAAPSLPWYRHFWPWFVLGLLGMSVAGSLYTVMLAFANRDSLVRDDWYRDGMAINRSIERDRNAERLGLRATARFDIVRGEAELDLAGESALRLAAVQLDLSHPTRAERDRRIVLARTAPGRFRGELPDGLEGRWYAALLPVGVDRARASADDWRLARTLQLPSAEPIVFGAAD
jgi:hypothetical protein